MDWYLTMVNVNAFLEVNPGYARVPLEHRIAPQSTAEHRRRYVTLPLEFFHHHIGRMLTDNVSTIPRRSDFHG
jgi:hypothetical protein